MDKKDLNLRILELFPQLAKAEDWQWDETEDGEPVVMVEANATFTGLADGAIDFTGPIPNTRLIGVYRIKPDGPLHAVGDEGRPDRNGAAEQASRN